MVAEQVTTDPLTTTDTAAPAAMAEPTRGQNESVYETALNNLDQILKATSEGKVQDGLAYLVVNFKNRLLGAQEGPAGDHAEAPRG